MTNDDRNTDWHQWKDTFLVAVSDYIQTKSLEGRNPICLVPYLIDQEKGIYKTKAKTISLEPIKGEVKKLVQNS